MDNSVILLIVGVILAGVFLPRWGLLTQLRRWRAARQSENMEDTLKILLDYQWENRIITAAMLATSLRISQGAAQRMIERMESQGLLEIKGGNLKLTGEGEQAALQITRAHRLLERYLAFDARMPLQKVHREAHRMEHRLTREQVNELEAAMGFPRHDPHGDPIPNIQGELQGECGTPLTSWELNTPARIVHLEDEPPLAFAQILAEGLRLDQMVRLLEVTPERYVFSDGENEYRLAPAVAANIYVAPLEEVEAAGNGLAPLSALEHNQRGEIVRLDNSCQGFTRRRFLDLGLTPGTEIYPELLNSFGDPRAYRVRGTLIALREDQAALIWVRPIQAS
ncbi:MAG: metal-dependent transcriptional regulator [Anaerolineales bacterium]|nr:metal-dependent transcriptional regulator [Anaerolineales bacterium]